MEAMRRTNVDGLVHVTHAVVDGMGDGLGFGIHARNAVAHTLPPDFIQARRQ
ncbi:hypothetical protein SBA6_160006 [Candidatus Sulfopaludibacter sp. SbA6]|nr:hypothetical protein SBA6_160006 [Candidatus Sulfopaludibacter sp. SbA6]